MSIDQLQTLAEQTIILMMLTWQVSFVCRNHSNSWQFSWSNGESDIRQGKEKEGVEGGVEVGVLCSRLLC